MSFIDFPIYNVLSDKKMSKYADKEQYSKLIVLVYLPDFIDKYQTNLSELIKAIKLNEKNDVSIITLNQNDKISLSNYYRELQFKYCLSFGISNLDLSLHIEDNKHKIIHFEKFQFISLENINILMEDNSLKKKLWLNLKKMFLS